MDEILKRARSIQEISAFMGSTDNFIREEIASGRLRARKLNTLIRILPDDLRSWLDNGIKPPKPPKPVDPARVRKPIGRPRKVQPTVETKEPVTV